MPRPVLPLICLVLWLMDLRKEKTPEVVVEIEAEVEEIDLPRIKHPAPTKEL